MTLKTVRSSVYGYRDVLVYTTLKPFHFGGAEYSSITRIIVTSLAPRPRFSQHRMDYITTM